LYELRKELKNRGHTINLEDLLKSLTICRRATIAISSRDKEEAEVFMDSSIFPTLVIARRRDWEKDPKNTRCYVQFNPLVTHSINKLAYRQFDYATFMTFKRQLARWFHKRLSHNYTQAEIMHPYTIKLSTVVRDSALVNTSRLRDKARYVNESLDELTEKDVLMHYKAQPVTGKRGKIGDITYILTPHPLFVGQIKKANSRKQHIGETARRAGLLDEEAYAVHRRSQPG
jgi:hypothetical protein